MKKFILFFSVFFSFATAGHTQPGKLDSSYGIAGLVKTDFGFIYDNNYATTGRQVLLQNDGKLSVLIESSGQSYLAQRLQDGRPDLSYGNNGFSSSIDISQAVAAMQPDGKIVIAGNDLTNTFAVARFNADGTVDNTFNSVGKQTTDFGSGYNIATAIAVQSDGKIVVAGYAYIGSSTDFAVARYNADGTVDNSFSNDGKQTGSFGSETNYAYSVAIQKDGKIVVAGQTYGASFSDFAIVRYNSNGTLDNSFSEDGKQTTDFGFSEDIARSAAIQSDGKIIISGYEYKCNDTCTNAQFALARYNTNGTLDNTFSEDGRQISSFASGYYATSLALQTDGKIVIAGYAERDNVDFALARFNTNGSIDHTFGTDGRLTTDFNSDDFAYSVAIQSDGKIVAAGYDYGDNFDLSRYNTDGSLDDTFGRSGKLTDRLRVNQGSTYYTSTAIQQDSKLVTAGYTWNGSNYDFAVARYNIDGSLDNSFSTDGKQTTDFASADEFAYSVAIQKDGKIVLAGASGPYFALSRYNTDGSLDKSFGDDGKKITNFGIDRSATAASAAIQKDGKIVVAGYTYGASQPNEDFALARYNINGTPDSTFSLYGKLTTDLGYGDIATSIAIQNDGKIIVAGNSSINVRGENSSFFALTRYNADGTLDNNFSEDGKQVTSFNQFSSAQSVALQNDGKIVVAGSTSSSSPNGEDFALARYNTDGSLDNTFGNDGTQITDLGSGSESANAVAIQRDGKIVAGGSSNSNFALARFNTNGSLDSNFNRNGIIITEASGQDDIINDIAISNNILYAVGYGEYPGNLGVVARYLLADEVKMPTVSLTIPYNIVKYTGPARIKLNAAVLNESDSIKKVRFYNGTIHLHTEDVFPYGFLWDNVPVGIYTLTAKAYDNKGQMITSNVIKVAVVDENVPPVVSMASPINDTTYSSAATIRLIANAKDPNDRISKVEFYSGTTLLRTEYIYPYTYTWTNVQPGSYTITAKATDDKGLSTTSASVTVTVTAPNVPMVSSRPFSADSKLGLTLKLSPNPASHTLQIYTSGLPQNKPSAISVISASGVVLKTIQSNTLAKIVQLDVSSLVSGVYRVKVVCADKVMYKPFVKL